MGGEKGEAMEKQDHVQFHDAEIFRGWVEKKEERAQVTEKEPWKVRGPRSRRVTWRKWLAERSGDRKTEEGW